MAVRKSVKSKKQKSFFKSNTFYVGIFIAFVLIISYSQRNVLSYYLGFKTNKIIAETRVASLDKVLDTHIEKSFGIDISEYQDKINWDNLKEIEGGFPIEFVFVRATVGNDRRDYKFKKYWAKAKDNKLICGAYHYYRPNENSLEQAAIFIKTVQLRKGDLPPVLDIESLPENQPIDSLKVGLRRWLQKIDAHYKVKPIIYTGEKYYNAFLKDEFGEYTFWIANYNFFVEDIKDDWLFWQFTERATVRGIPCDVDVNIYNGTPKMLQYLTIN